MSNDKNVTKKHLPAAARRALAEVATRRAKQAAHEQTLETGRKNEIGGPKNIEPTRYGDWERNGITYDF